MSFKSWLVFFLNGLLGIIVLPIWILLILVLSLNMIYRNVLGVFFHRDFDEAMAREDTDETYRV